MKILVTGGRGVVGKPLTDELAKRGHQVWIADRGHSFEANYYRCDVGEFHQVERLLEQQGFDYVYHLAAEFGRRNGEDFYENLWKSNAIGTKNIIRMQERLKFRMVFFSSSEVYGDYRDVMYEDVMDRVAIKQMNDYAMSKWVNEMQILNSAAGFGTESVRVRLFNTYGPGEYYSEYRSVICVFIYRALHNLPYTVYTEHQRTSSYIDDTVRTLANITDNFKPGEVYNIAGSELHDMKRASDIILKYLGKDDSLVEYKKRQDDTTLVKMVDASRAARDLGHESTVPLEEGIPRTIEWQKGVYGLG
ncbi:MAG TPA: NAD(P)-dependent oxidoreductase [Dehalococcoidales bacterium]|nr:MAG: nucleoside-diphosphate sugar epimerase [Chloroflexi bacterium RBG_16_60_22]HJX12041.1 NAD(P)-dependent oxidoreductase [Dehalococcoidales bacterium]